MLRIDGAATGTHSDVVIANNIAAWTQAGGSNSVSSGTGLTFSNDLWYDVTVGGASGAGDLTGQNPNLHG